MLTSNSHPARWRGAGAGGGETQATPTSAKAGTGAQGRRGQPCKGHREGHGGERCHTAWARKGARSLDGRPPGTPGEGASSSDGQDPISAPQTTPRSRCRSQPHCDDKTNWGSEKERARRPAAGQGPGTFLGCSFVSGPEAGLGCRGSTWQHWVKDQDRTKT